MKLLRYRQTAADDWGDIRHSRRPIAAAKPSRVDAVFKWGLLAWIMWAIWAPVALVILIAAVVLL